MAPSAQGRLFGARKVKKQYDKLINNKKVKNIRWTK